MTNRESVMFQIGRAVIQLRQSHRGRVIMADLLAFIEGQFVGADALNVDAVIELIRHCHSHPTSVMQALRGEDIK